MQFQIDNRNENIVRLSRKIGYGILKFDSQKQEYNLVCPVGGRYYPRFHIYLKLESGNLYFNLHLDQKQPSYKGSHAHSGEYDGKLVEEEAERIKSILSA